MEYSLLGQTGVRVSKISVGTMAYGVAPLAKGVDALVGRALDLGINLFDTANSYGNQSRFDREGAPPAAERASSEEYLGEALKGRRHEVILATKVQEWVFDGPNGGGSQGGGLSRKHITQQVEESLRRLQTDYIDIYYAHHPDPITPLEQTLRTVDDLVRQGKIRYFALSTFPGWMATKVMWLCDKLGLNPPACHQVRYNLAGRLIEREVVPASVELGLSLICFSPLAGGLLTGVQALRRPSRFQRRGGQGPAPEQVAVAEKIEALGNEWGHPPAHVALAWLLSRPGVASAITGPETIEELEENVGAVDLHLSDEQLEALDGMDQLPYTPPNRR